MVRCGVQRSAGNGWKRRKMACNEREWLETAECARDRSREIARDLNTK